MQKKLTAVGNSLALLIEKPILALLEIDKDTALDIRTDGERLIIEPVRKGVRRSVVRASREVLKKHGDTFRRLAKR